MKKYNSPMNLRLADPAYNQLPGAKVQQPVMQNPRPAMPVKDTGAPMPFTQPNLSMMNGVFGNAMPGTFNRAIDEQGLQNQTYI
jgi:hypothetical protein